LIGYDYYQRYLIVLAKVFVLLPKLEEVVEAEEELKEAAVAY